MDHGPSALFGSHTFLLKLGDSWVLQGSLGASTDPGLLVTTAFFFLLLFSAFYSDICILPVDVVSLTLHGL